MEAIRTANAKNRTWSQHVSKKHDHGACASMWKENAHRLRRTFYFAESFDQLSGKGTFEMWHSFLYFVWYAFPNLCTQISRHSSKASATAGVVQWLSFPIWIRLTPAYRLCDARASLFVGLSKWGFVKTRQIVAGSSCPKQWLPSRGQTRRDGCARRVFFVHNLHLYKSFMRATKRVAIFGKCACNIFRRKQMLGPGNKVSYVACNLQEYCPTFLSSSRGMLEEGKVSGCYW